jgi:2-polyprenyl-3-methyl-5-hydroxy-6-metoxy-1,4-benzoquinol methylase
LSPVAARIVTLDAVRELDDTTRRRDHWDDVYRSRGATGVSWFEPTPATSLAIIDAIGVGSDTSVVDVGGGASLLVDHLVDRGFTDLTVLDLSSTALELAASRLHAGPPVNWLKQDVLTWHPQRRYGLWHDRAVFHFLIDDRERRQYLDVMRQALEPNGLVILGTFAADGPEYCSGLPVARYAPGDLMATLGPGFELLDERYERHVTPADAVQPFTWIAARAVA